MSVGSPLSSADSQWDARRREYKGRISAAEKLLADIDRRSARIANARTVAFLGALAFFLLPYWDKLPDAFAWLGAACAAAFIALAARHAKLFREEGRAKVLLSLRRRALGRMEGGWREFPERGEKFLTEEHLYARDLDLFGHGSLFQLTDETATEGGELRLAQLLLSPSAPAEARSRQQAVAELSAKIDFRENLLSEAKLSSQEKVSAGPFLEWAERPPALSTTLSLRHVAKILPLVTLSLYIASHWGDFPRWAFWLALAAQVMVLAAARKELSAYYESALAGERGLLKYDRVFFALETQTFDTPLLAQLSHPSGLGASARLRRFAFLFSFAELRQSGLLHGIIHLLTLWDIHWLSALEGWRRRHGASAREWFSRLAECEALCSLGALLHARPHFVFPTLLEGPPHFESRGLAHPLLDSPVGNDVALKQPLQMLMVTGSNMSGKSTLLRAMGINAVLAQAGAPVCAQALSLSRLEVLTSMRVKDSLERGVSYFYAEVQRLKAVLDAAQRASGQALFLLDEILLGTNTRERQLASRQVLGLLLETSAVGAVATHDLSLTEWTQEEASGRVANAHFRDTLVDGRMRFDYLLRPGVVDTTNALWVLRQAGIPIRPQPG
jgi:hypothetical protein